MSGLEYLGVAGSRYMLFLSDAYDTGRTFDMTGKLVSDKVARIACTRLFPVECVSILGVKGGSELYSSGEVLFVPYGASDCTKLLVSAFGACKGVPLRINHTLALSSGSVQFVNQAILAFPPELVNKDTIKRVFNVPTSVWIPAD